MSTNVRINLIATALVAIALTLGAIVGTFLLGGTPTPTEAVVPATDTVCMMCTDATSGGGGGNVGTSPNGPGTMLGGTQGGSGNGGN